MGCQRQKLDAVDIAAVVVEKIPSQAIDFGIACKQAYIDFSRWVLLHNACCRECNILSMTYPCIRDVR